MSSILSLQGRGPTGSLGHEVGDLRPCHRPRALSHDLRRDDHFHLREPPVSRSLDLKRERERRVRFWRRGGAAFALVALLALIGVVVLPVGKDPRGPDPVAVSLVEYAFVPQEIHAVPGQTLAVTNDGAITHNLVIPSLGKGIELAAGDSGTMRVPAADPGTYPIVCDLTGHREAGMVGTIVIG
jgi:plastocyanin